LDRGAIRRAFEERFTSEAMALRYLDVYRRVIARSARQLAPIFGDQADPP
jgi:hypothetical protein